MQVYIFEINASLKSIGDSLVAFQKPLHSIFFGKQYQFLRHCSVLREVLSAWEKEFYQIEIRWQTDLVVSSTIDK